LALKSGQAGFFPSCECLRKLSWRPEFASSVRHPTAYITYAKADGSAIGDLSYTYDTAGRRTGVGGSLAQTNPGTPVSTTSVNAANQLTTFGAQTLTYDANGNLTGDGTNTYTWDARNQLQSIGGGNAASFQYDAFGRRIGKTIGTTSTGYLYDGMNFVQEKSGTGSGAGVTANLITGPGVDNILARQTAAGNHTMLTDALGSIILATDATQATVTSYSYDAYGNTTQVGTNDNSQQYTGRENDGTGLYYYRARYYSPAMGRFVSQDPIGWEAGQTNGYSYVGGDPISFIDPDGLARGKGPVPPNPNKKPPLKAVFRAEGVSGMLGMRTPRNILGRQKDSEGLEALVDLVDLDRGLYGI
jgi:RHS repeat-associated protein